MDQLRTRAVRKTLGRTPWLDSEAFPRLDRLSIDTYRSKNGVTIDLRASLEDVQAVLARALKPNRKLVTAVQFRDGSITEVTTGAVEGEVKLEMVPEEAKVAATVAVPTVGCPMPDFGQVDVRADRVLESFLTVDQIADYRAHGIFFTRGRDTGRPYLIAHRGQPKALARCGGRQLYDVEQGRPLCVHDWSVPPAEEMLALLLCVSLPGREKEVRYLPEAWS